MAGPKKPHPMAVAAQEDAVLRDQLDYLIRYHSRAHADCKDCNRLALIKVALLKRFE